MTNREKPASSNRFILVALVAAGLAAGCAPRADPFLGPDTPTALGPDGQEAAAYSVRLGTETWGEVWVWSNGVRETRVNVQPAGANEGRTVLESEIREPTLHVGYRVENHLDEPLTLRVPPEEVETLIGESDIAIATGNANAGGSLTIPPNGQRRFDITFRLPPTLDTDRIRAFRFYWELARNGRTQGNETVFYREGKASRLYYWPTFPPGSDHAGPAERFPPWFVQFQRNPPPPKAGIRFGGDPETVH